ncbi:MAG TPA: alpha/beta fold hydrolase [Myxococcota bacterium]|nr:alpha/beta fold hydrolase [Myxococcota bacterium]
MGEVLQVVLWILVIGALVRLHTAFWSRYFEAARYGDMVHFARTQDGWRLALHRYRPPDLKFAQPVILCHGMGANRHNFDISAERSLARDLAGRGFDVWSLELRGAGMSDRPGWFTGRKGSYAFDDHLNFDVPAALECVAAETGRSDVLWVGHSMGGMLGYAWQGLEREPRLAGLVTISAPVLLNVSGNVGWSHHLVRPMFFGHTIAFRPLARFFSPMMGWPPRWLSRIVVLKNGMEGAVMRRCLVNLTENTTGALMRQFFDWIRTGRFESTDGQTDYLGNLARIKVPVLIIAADADKIASPEAVSPAYERVASEDRQLRIFGIDRGDDADFGHGDILLGVHSRELLYPEISNWLQQHASPITGDVQVDSPKTDRGSAERPQAE